MRVSPELYAVLSLAARYLFALLALLSLLHFLRSHAADRRERRQALRSSPGAGTVGELVVLRGSGELEPETWLPVPREGVLGSLRSCDLVIPCEGVEKNHLDFSWQDGQGLLLMPRSGCEVTVDGQTADCRSRGGILLRHGSILQAGRAALRFQVFTALVPAADSFPASGAYLAPAAPAAQPAPALSRMPWTEPDAPSAALSEDIQASEALPYAGENGSDPDRSNAPVPSWSARPRQHSDRWKEDFSE